MDDYHSFVEEMKAVGLTVKIEYYRYRSLYVVNPENVNEILYTKPTRVSRYYRRSKSGKQFVPYPKGGMSVLSVYDGDKVVACGVGRCMISDNYSYREARHYALEDMSKNGFLFNESLSETKKG